VIPGTSKRTYAGLQRLVNAWDPLGVLRDPTWPRDEYDCLVGPLLTCLERGMVAEEITAFLVHELQDHFGIDAAASQPAAFAAMTIAWFAEQQHRH
jgi:hypothetical protein